MLIFWVPKEIKTKILRLMRSFEGNEEFFLPCTQMKNFNNFKELKYLVIKLFIIRFSLFLE